MPRRAIGFADLLGLEAEGAATHLRALEALAFGVRDARSLVVRGELGRHRTRTLFVLGRNGRW